MESRKIVQLLYGHAADALPKCLHHFSVQISPWTMGRQPSNNEKGSPAETRSWSTHSPPHLVECLPSVDVGFFSDVVEDVELVRSKMWFPGPYLDIGGESDVDAFNEAMGLWH